MVNRNDSTASAVKWPTRETAVLRLVIVHWVEGGKITLWKDDWDVWG